MTGGLLMAQNKVAGVPEVKTCVYSDVSIPLREMTPEKKPFWNKWFRAKEGREVPNKFKKDCCRCWYASQKSNKSRPVYSSPTIFTN